MSGPHSRSKVARPSMRRTELIANGMAFSVRPRPLVVEHGQDPSVLSSSRCSAAWLQSGAIDLQGAQTTDRVWQVEDRSGARR